MFKDKHNKKEKGVSLFLAIVMLTIFVAMVLGLTTIFISQLRMFRGIGNSVIAFYAADAGIERVLMGRDDPCGGSYPCNASSTLANGATYEVFVNSTTTDPTNCLATDYCIRSIGTFRQTNRAIEINY